MVPLSFLVILHYYSFSTLTDAYVGVKVTVVNSSFQNSNTADLYCFRNIKILKDYTAIKPDTSDYFKQLQNIVVISSSLQSKRPILLLRPYCIVCHYDTQVKNSLNPKTKFTDTSVTFRKFYPSICLINSNMMITYQYRVDRPTRTYCSSSPMQD